MPWFAKLMYRGLVWKERQRARRGNQPALRGRRARHLATGQRGETLAYWLLRQAGYRMVARNRRARAGEVDLIGWDGPVLAFVEVKTRSSETAGPPQAAVSRSQERRIIRAAHEHLRGMKHPPEACRFDIVSVVWDEDAGYQARLIKDAFKA